MEQIDKKHLVYITTYVGNLGTKFLINEKRDILLQHYSNVYIDKVLSDCGSMPLFNLDNIKVLDKELISKGGVLAALWKICERNKFGLRYDLSKIPVLQGTIEFSNFFDITPYRLMTENSYILISDEDIKDAHLIGETNSGKKRVRIDGEAEAFLTKCYRDEIDKICK